MRFEKKNRFYCCLWSAILIVLGIGNGCLLSHIDMKGKLEVFISSLLVVVATIAEFIVCGAIIMHFAEKIRENIEKFEFLKYLDMAGEIKVRSKIDLPDMAPILEEELVKKQKIYYVKKGPYGGFCIWRENKKGEEKWSACLDYECFFKYFEPVYDDFTKEEE